MKGRDGESFRPFSRVSFWRWEGEELIPNMRYLISRFRDEMYILTKNLNPETSEGLDKKLNLHYYSRMRFIYNLLPQLTATATSTTTDTNTTKARPLSRVISILSPGQEGSLDLNDLALKHHFSLRTCATHSITMNSLMVHEFASRNPSTSFIHAYPSGVKTGVMRDLGPWSKVAAEVVGFLAKPFMVPLKESGERHLYAATSEAFPPKESGEGSAASNVAVGSDGVKGSGGYLLNWNGEITGKQAVLAKYRAEGVGKTVWEHTFDVFQKVCGTEGGKY